MSSIENVLQTLLSDKSVAEKITKQLTEPENSEEIQTDIKSEKQDSLLYKKINLINAIIPLLSEKTAEQAKFLIKLLTLISAIEEMKQSQ